MIDDVLGFWFGKPATNAEELGGKMQRWYRGGADLDAEIREKFTVIVDQAIEGELEWNTSIRGRLALVLVLDQFTRSVYRDDAKMYAGDVQAQAFAGEVFDRKLERGLATMQRHFMLMPFMHAENLELQERAVLLLAENVEKAAEFEKALLATGQEQTQKYRDIIAKFGRFPHRNAVLGRKSTPEEAAFLVEMTAKTQPAGAHDLPS